MSNRRELLHAFLRADLSCFIAKCFATLEPGGHYQTNWHIDHIAYELARVRAGDTKRLIVNVPSRHLKSICVTVAYTAWVLGHNPSLKVMTVSYGSGLAEQLARSFRIVVESEWYRATFPRFQIAVARRAEVITSLNGGRYAASVGGGVLGRGADLIVIDDPMKAGAAHSEAERRRVHDFYDNTLSTRLNNKLDGAIILVMQRLHEDDLCGHLISREQWHQSVIPAIATEDRDYQVGPRPHQLHHRLKGDVIQASRESDITLIGQRRLLGSMNFEAQYQQNPVPPDGNAIKREWLRYYETFPLLDLTIVSWDTASTLGETSDYSVGTVWGFKGTDIYLVDLVRGKFEVPALRRMIIGLHSRHNAATTLIEKTDIGRAIIQEMRNDRTIGFRPILRTPKYDKQARILSESPKFEAGQVLLPKNGPWLGEYERELLAFPNGQHDDQVDSTSQALIWLSKKIGIGASPRRQTLRRPRGTDYPTLIGTYPTAPLEPAKRRRIPAEELE